MLENNLIEAYCKRGDFFYMPGDELILESSLLLFRLRSLSILHMHIYHTQYSVQMANETKRDEKNVVFVVDPVKNGKLFF